MEYLSILITVHLHETFILGTKVEITSWSWSEGYKKIDATDKCREIVAAREEEKYKDIGLIHVVLK